MMFRRNPLSLRAVIEARLAENAIHEERTRREKAEADRVAAILRDNPRIGVLQRVVRGRPKTVYYVNFPTYKETVDIAELASHV
jgi:hypothetical protein